MIDQACKSLYRIAVLILTLNYSFALIGFMLRPQYKAGQYNEVMRDVLIWQGLFLLVYFLMMFVFLRAVTKEKLIVPKVKHLNIILWIFIFFLLITVPTSWDYSSYRAFAPYKSTIPEYTILIVAIILLNRQGKFGWLDRILLLMFACFFLLAGYRMVAVYYIIFFVFQYNLKAFILYGGSAFALIVYTQIARLGIDGFSAELVLTALTINAFDTLFSSARVILVNSTCDYGIELLISYFLQAFPIPSSLSPALYLDNIKACTNIPGGGAFFAYWFYLLGFDGANGIMIVDGIIALLSFCLLVGLVLFMYSLSPGTLIVGFIFAFRAFNYGPVALFRPAIIFLCITFLLLLGLKVVPKRTRQRGPTVLCQKTAIIGGRNLSAERY